MAHRHSTEVLSLQVDTAEDDSPSARRFRLLFHLAQASGLGAVILVTLWMSLYEGGLKWSGSEFQQFHYHPLLMVVGFVFLQGQAILVYRVLRSRSKRATKLIHAVLHGATIIMALLAIFSVLDSHSKVKEADGSAKYREFFSVHSWVGVTAVALFILQYIVGFVTFLWPGLSPDLRHRCLPLHRTFGLIIFATAGYSVVAGVAEHDAWDMRCWREKKEMCLEFVISNVVGLLSVVYTVLVIVLTVNSDWKRKPLPEEKPIARTNVGYGAQVSQVIY